MQLILAIAIATATLLPPDDPTLTKPSNPPANSPPTPEPLPGELWPNVPWEKPGDPPREPPKNRPYGPHTPKQKLNQGPATTKTPHAQEEKHDFTNPLPTMWQAVVQAVRKSATKPAPDQLDRNIQQARLAFLRTLDAKHTDNWETTQPDPDNPYKIVTLRGTIVDEPIVKGSDYVVLLKTAPDTYYPVRFPKKQFNPNQPYQHVAGIIIPKKIAVKNRVFPWYIEPTFWVTLNENLHDTLPIPDSPPDPKPKPKKKGGSGPTIGRGWIE